MTRGKGTRRPYDPAMTEAPMEDPAGDLDFAYDPDGGDSRGEQHDYDLTDEEVQSAVTSLMQDAVSYYAENMQQRHDDATNFYHGAKTGRLRGEDDRSQVVSTELRDATLQQMPSILDTFFGAEHSVEFAATHRSAMEIAEQMTRWVEYNIREENDGFIEFWNAIEDALVRGLGVWKWWHEEYDHDYTTYQDGVSEAGLAILQREGEIIQSQNPDGTYRVKLTRHETKGCVRFAAIPNEEFVFTPRARSLRETAICAHVREVPVAKALEMGVPEDLAEAKVGERQITDSSESLDTARHQDTTGSQNSRRFLTQSADWTQRPIVVAEVYMRIGGELKQFLCVGNDYEIVPDEDEGLQGVAVDEIPFAVPVPTLRAHMIPGLSNFDLLEENQVVSTELNRRMLDSLAESIEPTAIVNAAKINMGDLLNPEISGVIRTRGDINPTEAYWPIQHTFVGASVLPVLEWWRTMREESTGTSRAAKGLDADALQSSTKAAVEGTFTMSQMRIKLIAKTIAETGVKRLYKGLLRLAIQHPDSASIMRLNGKLVDVDPRWWDSALDVRVRIDNGSREERLTALTMVLSDQKEQLATGSPLVTLVEYRRSLDKFVKLLGYPDSTEFYREFGDAEMQQMEQAKAQQPPQPDPAMALVEIEKMKVQTETQLEMLKLQLEQQKAEWQDARERVKIANDAVLREHDIEAKNKVEIDDRQVRMQTDAQLRQQEIQLAHERETEKIRLQHERESAAQQQQAAQSQGGE